jgi:hypothetical protein
MQKLHALALIAGSVALAESTIPPAVPPPPPPPYYGIPTPYPPQPADDSARLAQFAKAFSQSGSLPDSAGNWQPMVPDSIRVRLQANHQAISAQRDSLRARLAIKPPDSIRVQVQALRDSALMRRDTYLGTINPSDRAQVAPKLEQLDARSQARKGVIDGSSSPLKARKGQRNPPAD